MNFILYFNKWTFNKYLLKGGRMSVKISIIIGDETIHAELNDSETSKKIMEKLPLESDFSTWGDEIYFSIPVKTGAENSKDIVESGEIGYWPPGNAFCIFLRCHTGVNR